MHVLELHESFHFDVLCANSVESFSAKHLEKATRVDSIKNIFWVRSIALVPGNYGIIVIHKLSAFRGTARILVVGCDSSGM